MAEVNSDLLFEVLKSIRADIADVRDEVRAGNVRLGSLSEQVRGLALEVHAAHTDIANVYTQLDKVNGRLSRIERRLDIVEEPAE